MWRSVQDTPIHSRRVFPLTFPLCGIVGWFVSQESRRNGCLEGWSRPSVSPSVTQADHTVKTCQENWPMGLNYLNGGKEKMEGKRRNKNWEVLWVSRPLSVHQSWCWELLHLVSAPSGCLLPSTFSRTHFLPLPSHPLFPHCFFHHHLTPPTHPPNLSLCLSKHFHGHCFGIPGV